MGNNRDGDLEDIFKYVNRTYPPTHSQDEQLRFGTKVHLLKLGYSKTFIDYV